MVMAWMVSSQFEARLHSSVWSGHKTGAAKLLLFANYPPNQQLWMNICCLDDDVDDWERILCVEWQLDIINTTGGAKGH